MSKDDQKILKRLLSYAKPYIGWFSLALLLMLITTGLDLAKPVLLGKAVDVFMSGYKVPFQIVEEGTQESLVYDNMNLSKHTNIELSDQGLLQIVQYNKAYYLIKDIDGMGALILQNQSPEEFTQIIEKVHEDQLTLKVQDEIYHAKVLNSSDLKILRSLDFQGLFNIATLFFGILVLGFILIYAQTLILQHAGQKIIYSIRGEIYEHVLGLPLRFFHSNPIGTLVTRVTNDTETLNEMYTSVLVNLLRHLLFMAGVIAMMLYTNVAIALKVFMVIPVIMIATAIFRRYSRKAYRKVRNKITDMNAFLSEHISGIKIIQIFRQEKAKLHQFNQVNESLYKANIEEMTVFMIFRPFMFILSSVALCIVLLTGGKGVLQGTLSVGVLMIMLQYTGDFFAPVEELAENFNVLQSAMASAEKIFSILDQENEIKSGPIAIKKNKFLGKIEFKNVWFAYEGEEWVLKDISFVIEPGERVAFVGATGAGKTSILSLINRYYDVQKGEILIDDMDIKKIDIHTLRAEIGQVLQDVFMFTGDIKSNIRLGQKDITDQAVRQAAKYVNAHGFIKELPKGYEEAVYEGGATLSTGQRQLLSFARAIAFEPKIFVLDEATASIDTETEGLIQDAMEKLMEGRTTLMVAHRLSTIQHADNIIVLHKGWLREMGAHQELLAQRGLYYHLYLQASNRGH